MKKIQSSLIVNHGLLFSAFASMFSGILIQLQFHIGNNSNQAFEENVFGLNYSVWSQFHKISILLLTVFTVFHISLHWKWYNTVIVKRLFSKNKELIALTLVFILAAISGFVPWLVHLFEGATEIRKTFIEIHDKIAIILSVYFILHIIKRLKWFYK